MLHYATMLKQSTPTIINVGYRSTNYWVVSVGTARILVDLGWPGTVNIMLANLKRMGVALSELRYAMATHYHLDHAGTAQNLKLRGVPLLVLETQVAAIAYMKRWTKPEDHYTDITLYDNVNITFADSRAILERIGIAGEILATPGHSDDSVSLVLDNGAACTGDLPPVALADDHARPLVAASWRLLHEHGAKHIYPGHGPVRTMAGADGMAAMIEPV